MQPEYQISSDVRFDVGISYLSSGSLLFGLGIEILHFRSFSTSELWLLLDKAFNVALLYLENTRTIMFPKEEHLRLLFSRHCSQTQTSFVSSFSFVLLTYQFFRGHRMVFDILLIYMSR